ncbi:hypothetical protein CCS01_07690 [Rhodopila globiformis]|uniref:Uncharacterized protein n=1 Tax=Rhodopila globiformis TaxID=1071 RepID=A0A2S6NKA4_RHOGL|nr:hypothetical protein CCS01_07690 [Rhodopila globiformis]
MAWSFWQQRHPKLASVMARETHGTMRNAVAPLWQGRGFLNRRPRSLAVGSLLLFVSAAASAQTAPGSGGQTLPAEPPAQQTPTAQPGAQPTGNLILSIWNQDTLTDDWNGWRKRLLDAGVVLGLQEQSELWGNMTGGLRQGVVYDGLTTASVQLDLGRLLGWDDMTFFVSGYQIHGRGPSENLVGNLQFLSNVEATRDTKLYALWLEQKFLRGRLTLRLGQEGANDQMMITQYGALFLNASFGYPALAAVDLPDGGPNYPLAAPFVRAQYEATSKITAIGAVFTADPARSGLGDPDMRDKGGVAFRLNDHVLVFTELWYALNQEEGAPGLPGTYKLGAWFASGHLNSPVLASNGLPLASPASSGMPLGHATDYAVYGIVDQLVRRNPGSKDKGIGVFLQVKGAPGNCNLSNLFIEGGLNWTAPLSGRDNDAFGWALRILASARPPCASAATRCSIPAPASPMPATRRWSS